MTVETILVKGDKVSFKSGVKTVEGTVTGFTKSYVRVKYLYLDVLHLTELFFPHSLTKIGE